MSANVILGIDVSRPIRKKIVERAENLRQHGWIPRLASLQIGHSPAADIYIRNQGRVAKKLNIDFENRIYPDDISQQEMLASIHALNVNPRVSGIILQRPVPKHLDLQQLQMAISPSKDVEGMHPSNIGKVVYDDFILGPCTSLASVEILRYTGVPLRGLEVVVVGHSEIVGKPIALHLMADLATVTICHHGTRSVKEHTLRADAIFVAVGKPGLITADMVKPGAVVIDIGINSVEVEKDGKMVNKTVGDVDFEAVKEVAGWITPVPRGVGPVTLTMLFNNVVAALEQQKLAYERAMVSG